MTDKFEVRHWSCLAKMRISEDQGGQRIKCPKCGSLFRAPKSPTQKRGNKIRIQQDKERKRSQAHPPSVDLSTQARWALLRRLKVQYLVMVGVLIALFFLLFPAWAEESKVTTALFGTLFGIDLLLCIVWRIRIWLNTTTQ